ncbi:hypothetical protein BIU88_04630 [Chlorobaculum limnaeum]|uniref:Uncharacterized protein n=1 Tax=Chlorobaculum limnaeum TaxID=274537 RepID=A0A1D8D614_CHLLM|nr:hypothetical protein [Chlorobaculum limnaeum]AOS83488.1 hypothetical protein BIU88_04630 [Chlorobaculum limnaeum]
MGYDFTEIYQKDNKFDIDIKGIKEKISLFRNFSSIPEDELEYLPKYAAVIATAMIKRKKQLHQTSFVAFIHISNQLIWRTGKRKNL